MSGLLARGHEVEVLCGDTRVAGAAAPDPNHEAHVRRDLRLYHDGAELQPGSLRHRLDVERHNQAVLREVLDRFRPEVVSAWHFGALSLGLLTTIAEAGIPIVYAVCDDWLVYGRKLDAWARLFDGSAPRRLAGRIARAALRVPTTVTDLGPTGPVLFVTDAVRKRARELAPWSFPESTVVYSGIDRTTFPARPVGPDRPWQWRLVTSGRPDPRKGFETAIRALALLPAEATLTHYGLGGDEERGRLAGIAAELGLADRVTFGSVPRAELPAVYEAGDVMLFPSEWDEPFGLVPVEAMACGTPVVASVQWGTAEFLFDEVNVLAYPPGDAVALAKAVERLAADPTLRRRLVTAGHSTAEALDVERLVDAMETWHLWVADGRRGPRPADRPPPVSVG